MGTHVETIANHKLNTTNVQALAEDLSHRLNAIVKYGYVNDRNITDDFEFKEQGRFGAGEDMYRVHDTYYFERLDNTSECKGKTCFELILENSPNDFGLYIFRDSFLPDNHYNGKWWSFCKIFMGELNWWDSIDQFRKESYRQTLLLGGESALYLADQGEGSFDAFELEKISFNEFFNKVKENSNHIDITEWIESGGNVPMDYPPAFIDDFKSFGYRINEKSGQ